MSATVIVTGAGSGIGAAVALEYSKNNYNVVLTGRRKEKLDQVAQDLPNKSFVIPCDLNDPEAIKNFAQEAIKQAGPIDVLVNNAGTLVQGPLEESSDEDWQKMFNIHVMAPVRLSKALIPHFKERGQGSIVTVASTAGIRPVPGYSAYGAAKAASNYFSNTLALELAPFKIRVNTICPGIVNTEMINLDVSDKKKEKADALHPIGRAGYPFDIARSVYHIGCIDAEWITGTNMVVDGGISLL